MGPDRRRFLELMGAASVVSVAGCSSSGDGDAEDDGGSGDSTDGGESTNGDSDSGGDSDTSNSDDTNADSSDTSNTSGDSDSENDATSDDDSGGDSEDGDTESDEQIQPADVSGSVRSSVAELEVVSHKATTVSPQVRIEVELRNAGDDDSIALTHHNFDSRLFNAAGTEILREQVGTRGPETMPSSGESRVVEVFLFPEEGTEPASYEITINCDGVDYDAFTYCESE